MAEPGTDAYITTGNYHEAASGSMASSVYRAVLYSMKILSSHIRTTFRYGYVSANCRRPKRMVGRVVTRLSFLGAPV